jgi:hypothetical protein
MRRLFVLLYAALLCAACSAPPQKEIDQAQGALDAAKAAGAEQYAADAYKSAADALAQAHDAVAQRDYRLALSRAVDASERAKDAARLTADGMARARSEADRAVAAAAGAVKQLLTRLGQPDAARLPPRTLYEPRKTAKDLEATVQKARAAIGAGDYLAVPALVDGIPERIAAEIEKIDEAASARPARPPRRRR